MAYTILFRSFSQGINPQISQIIADEKRRSYLRSSAPSADIAFVISDSILGVASERRVIIPALPPPPKPALILPRSSNRSRNMSASLYEIPLKTITGTPTSLGEYSGKVLLVVNVASKCGLTPQYEGLQKLYAAKHADGLEIVGFPANDFAGQEPGTSDEIAEFCSTKYNVTFPVMEKITVVGEAKHPLYQALTEAQPTAEGGDGMRENLKKYGINPNPPPEVLWNFEKFVVGRNGEVTARFTPDTAPDDPKLLAAVDAALAE
jgi:glutathione peroxidase